MDSLLFFYIRCFSIYDNALKVSYTKFFKIINFEFDLIILHLFTLEYTQSE